MSATESRSFLIRALDKLPYAVAAGLSVSACVFAAIMVVTSLHGKVDYATVNNEEHSAVIITAEVGNDSLLKIPLSVGMPWDEHRVRKIDNHAFDGNEGFNELSLPNGLRVIGYSSFYGCKKLRSLTLPSSVEEINDGAFYGCTSLKSIRLSPNLNKLGEFIFERCTSLTDVDIPEGMQILPRSIFCACSSLAEVDLPASITTIEPLAFKDCTALTEIIFPDNTRDIGGCAFEMCTALRRVVIPEHVNGLGVTAFNGCTSLTEVVCLAATPPPLGSSVFDGINSNAVLFVPQNSVEVYKTSDWGEYFRFIRAIGE